VGRGRIGRQEGEGGRGIEEARVAGRGRQGRQEGKEESEIKRRGK
jgi:hypothetical protein